MNKFKSIRLWCSSHVWQSILIVVACVAVIATSITLPIVLSKKDDEKGEVDTHTHTFASEWTYDENNHWHEATCEHKGEKSEVAPHTLNSNGKCTVCDYSLPNKNKVTQTEWEAAFGIDKPFYIADNYKLESSTTVMDITITAKLYVDGNVLKVEDKESTEYFEVVDSTKYKYSEDVANKVWKKEQVEKTRVDEGLAPYFTALKENFSNFTFDDADNTYKCGSINYQGKEYRNINIKFEDKKVMFFSWVYSMEVAPGAFFDANETFSFTYGGQEVEVPVIWPLQDIIAKLGESRAKAMPVPSHGKNITVVGNPGYIYISIDEFDPEDYKTKLLSSGFTLSGEIYEYDSDLGITVLGPSDEYQLIAMTLC